MTQKWVLELLPEDGPQRQVLRDLCSLRREPVEPPVEDTAVGSAAVEEPADAEEIYRNPIGAGGDDFFYFFKKK